MLPILISSPTTEVVAETSLHLKKSSNGFEFMLLLTGHFNEYSEPYPTRNRPVKTAAGHIYNDFIYGLIYYP